MDPFTLIVIFVITTALTIALAPKPKFENARPAGQGDFVFPTTTEDRPEPIIFGTVMVAGPNVAWYGDFKQKAIKEKVKTGPFSSKRVVVGYKYYMGVQFGICRGGPVELLGIWIGDKQVFSGSVTTNTTVDIDKPKLFGGNKLGTGGVVGTFRYFVGTTTQPPSAYLSTFQDLGFGTPRYTGLCYGVFEQGYLGNSTQIQPWKFEVRRMANGLGLSTGDAELNSGNDMNPMNVAYEMITNSEWGMRYPAADVDIASFTAAAETLADEDNGFSMVLDRVIECEELKLEIERQIDGKIFISPQTGKWTCKLIRDDYLIGFVPQLTPDTNIKRVISFQNMTWGETSNEVRVIYSDRITDYKDRPAFAQDAANQRLQGGGSAVTGVAVPQELHYPGIKDRTLAANVAWRELRKMSYPLKSAQLEVTRSLWAISIGDVVALSCRIGQNNYFQLPMRVLKIDRGDSTAKTIKLDCVQDIFRFAESSYAPLPPTSWEPPQDDLDPFDDVIVFEAPRGVVVRDPESLGLLNDKLWCGAVALSAEVGFQIYTRVSPDPYSLQGEVYGLLLKATLNGALPRGSGTSASFTLTMASSTDKTDLLIEVELGLTPTAIGTDLRHWLMIDNEFVLVTTIASGAGNDVTCTGVYRGVLDSVQGDHANGADVWVLFMSGGVTDNSVNPVATVDVKLLPFSATDEVTEAEVTAVSITTANRLRLPIPPGRVLLNGVLDDVTSVSLEGAGSGDTIGIDLELRRRDYRTTDETRALITDAAVLFADFPTLNSTDYQVEVRNDPAGANTLLFTIAYDDGPTFRLERNDILQGTDGVLPTTLGVVVRARHVYEGTTYTALFDLPWAFTTATALTGQFNFGALDQNETSNLYTATQTGTYNFSVNTAFATGQVEYRLNGGAFTALIVFPATTGSILAVVATDTIEIRHTSGTAGSQTFLAMDAPSTGQDGYAVLYKV